ncbi:MAG TPA: bifunctional [glutamine synthetase] adenylyltransferase/[glutamine synthetase]-adenylyl-L-tyrosine phosphorylase, partial [Acidimicrobiia bacterium]|nr:bifunctional [glutamine synthetase] adenylyltransferase/[glutamine synthetase]-adenylyl-L-tyrosine phosphorylase [Acidimicrobiia bacterium]
MPSAGDVVEQPDVRASLEAAADAPLARRTVERLVEADPQVAGELVGSRRVRDAVVAVACASRSLTTALVHDPSLVAALGNTSARLDPAPPPDAGALRRWKQRGLLRIAAADLLGEADLATVARRLAELADACLAVAVELAAPTSPLAVIGMGKLGGRELNYASDVDVLFVHEGDTEAALRTARRVLTAMSEPTEDGIVFRTDAALRPEGKAGALSRTLESYAAWYERWAQPWEFQALLKARAVAGDATLGQRFVDETRPFVWPDVLDPDTIRAARAMKARSEAEQQRRGVATRELKRGPGGIRDVEFAVQLLQLVHGRPDPTLRCPATLDALGALAAGGYVEPDDADVLTGSYTFLRAVEHRLQLRDETQTHTVPADVASRTGLARVLGYRDRPGSSAVDAFDTDLRTHQADVRAVHERLFFAPILDTLAGVGQLSAGAAETRLVAFGFVDAEHTRVALSELTAGLTRTSRVLRALLPVVLDWLSSTPNPDLGLLQLRRLTEAPMQSQAMAATFRDQPGTAERVCRVLGSSRVIGDELLRQPDVVELLGADDWFAAERTGDELREAARAALGWRPDPASQDAGLRRFKRRELLRIAARDIVGLAPLDVTSRELAGLADACVDAALAALQPPLPFAVIGMGRLGGQELSYASDIDVLFVYDGDDPSDLETASGLARQLTAALAEPTAEGQTFRVDANLRPEGRQGPLARSLDSYRAYYERWALVWEHQALLRARPVAGDVDLGHRFVEMVQPIVYREPFPEDDAREVRRIKARVERERIPPGEDPNFHLKSGRGALTDIEFTVQLLQLQHGAAAPQVRDPATRPALAALADAGFLAADDAAVL